MAKNWANLNEYSKLVEKTLDKHFFICIIPHRCKKQQDLAPKKQIAKI